MVNNHGDRKSPKWGYGTPYKWPKPWLLNGGDPITTYIHLRYSTVSQREIFERQKKKERYDRWIARKTLWINVDELDIAEEMMDEFKEMLLRLLSWHLPLFQLCFQVGGVENE